MNRSTLIAYGGWGALSFCLLTGTIATLQQSEVTERRAVLDRAEAAASIIEQVVLRVWETAWTLQNLAETRTRLLTERDAAGAAATEWHLRSLLDRAGPIVRAVSILRPDHSVAWSTASDGSAAAQHWNAGSAMGDPVRGPDGHWSLTLSRPMHDVAGMASGYALVTLDPIALSDAIGRLDVSSDISGKGAHGAASLVQRRGDGRILASGRMPGNLLTLRVALTDPVLREAAGSRSGHFRAYSDGLDRLVGFRSPVSVPVVVSRSYDAQAALAEFYALRRIVLGVVLALLAGTLAATRLILANFLLRQRLSEQALLDPLTGLRNRRYFVEFMPRLLTQAQAQGKSAIVLLVDLDGFKQVNDTRGHQLGDQLLQDVAARLARCVPETDTILRLGGDEFAVVRIGRIQRRDGTALARYIVSALSEIYEVDGYHVRVSASVGVAMPPEGGQDLDDLLRSADAAMYFAKSDGGAACRIFDPAMEETVRNRRELEFDLREALARRELEIFYQPLVRTKTERVTGFEALLRWHHPRLGLVMPGRFIQIAEQTGLITRIGEWVLREACAEAARWPGQIRVAVNLSPVQFDRSDIVDIVEAALRSSRLEPSRLELEITEGAIMRDMGEVLSTMQRLRALGVRLAMDDFGTGYSSLSYLRSLPFDKIKVDGSFMADLHGDGGPIIRAVLGLCEHLGLDTLVECVETEEQLAWLQAQGCTEAQGFLFSGAVPSNRVPEVIGTIASRRTIQFVSAAD